MTINSAGIVTPNMTKARGRHSPSPIDYVNSSTSEGRASQPIGQAEALRRAEAYAQAATRNAAFGRELGGRHGAVLVHLAGHFARRAVAFRLAAGGLA